MKPKAVLISDVHFNINTLSLATYALNKAISHAEKLNIPLIICGDLNDTKAILRAEVANALIDILSSAKPPIYILVGNHDLINEKGKDHSLYFLAPYCNLIDQSREELGIYFIPYCSDPEDFKAILSYIPKGSTIIMHQGVRGAFLGDYIQDKSSTEPDLLADYTVFSGHYHRHQKVGTVTYIGNPFTMSFGEAHDGHKGYLVLNEDATFERVNVDLRRHIVMEARWDDPLLRHQTTSRDDLVWLKIYGPRSELEKLDKKEIGEAVLGHCNFKLDLIADATQINDVVIKPMSHSEHLDHLIDRLSETDEYKAQLKKLWREVCALNSSSSD